MISAKVSQVAQAVRKVFKPDYIHEAEVVRRELDEIEETIIKLNGRRKCRLRLSNDYAGEDRRAPIVLHDSM